jgi:putative transposase
MEQNRCMKGCLARHGIAYPVLEPGEKRELLRLGALLGHKVKDLFVVNTWATYRHWLRIERSGNTHKRPGRHRSISEAVCRLVVRLAKENADWGLLRIVGELKKLKIAISTFSVKSILTQNGMEPPPRKGKKKLNGVWRKFIDAHMDTTVAIDFFTCKIVTLRGVFLAHSLVFLHHASRRVWISTPTLNPDEDWNIRQIKGAFWWPVPGRHSRCRVNASLPFSLAFVSTTVHSRRRRAICERRSEYTPAGTGVRHGPAKFDKVVKRAMRQRRGCRENFRQGSGHECLRRESDRAHEIRMPRSFPVLHKP